MPGLSQLKKFNSDILALGNEVHARASRGEKPIIIPIPKTVRDVDDSVDFVLGMPESPESAIPAQTSSEAEDFSDIILEVASNPDKDLHIVVLRDGEKLSYTVHSDFDKSTGSGKIGVTPFSNEAIKREAKRYPFFKALVEGIKRTGETLSLTVKSIALLFKGADVQNAISGPVGVAGMLGNTVEDGFGAGFRQGITAILELMAFISISLFIMNLLPIPVLDGALIFFAFVEFVCRRPINPKIQYYAQYAGLAIIAALFVLGITSDIRRFTAALQSH